MRRRAWGRLPAALGSVACMLVTLTACSPLDMLAFLGGCKNTGGSSTVQASQASGEWTGLVGRRQDQIKQMWPGQVSFCAPYDYGFQCTWWACMRQKSLGHDIGQYWGNGGEWDTSARNAGWEQGAQAGGIIVFNPGAGGSSSVYGHVAVVEQVNGDTVHTSEGGTGWGKVATRSFSASHPPAGISYWHPKGGGGAGAESVVQADSPSHSGPASGLATLY